MADALNPLDCFDDDDMLTASPRTVFGATERHDILGWAFTAGFAIAY
jgi:hypothetical protein